MNEVAMTITLELAPEAEASLVAQANARGLSQDAFLHTIIAAQAVAMESARSVQSLHSGGQDPDRLIDELFDIVQMPPRVGEGAMRRENWYR
jgi:hypothetical protein